MIPNKTEEQIFYLNFKYCDLSNSGQCNLRDFIKTNERIGVVMPKIKDLETIFYYFAKDNNDSLDYRAFSNNIFKLNLLNPNEVNGHHNQGGDEDGTALSFVNRLQNALIHLGGSFALINFAKELFLIDSSNSLRITLDDLLRVCADCKLKLTNEDVQLLFHSFDLFNNGIFHYTKILHQLKHSFWNPEREKQSIDFYTSLVAQNKGKSISIDELKKQFKGDDKEEFNYFIDAFKYIMKYANGSSLLTQKDTMEFVKYYGFGVESNEELNTILFDAFINESSSDNANCFSKPVPCSEIRKGNEAKTDKALNSKLIVFGKLKQVLSKFGKKTLFNFIKHFKYYDNGTKYISKYDFVKVLKDFNIHLPIIEIENLFEQFSKDKNKTSINYDLFISDLITSSLNEIREGMILDIYDSIATYAKSIKAEVTIDLLKGLYNSKNEPKGKDENELLIEFNECIELFLFGYKGNRTNQVSKEDFAQFYCFIAFLVYSDDELIEMLNREWSKCFKNTDCIQSNNNREDKCKEIRTTSKREEKHKQQDQKQSYLNNQSKTNYQSPTYLQDKTNKQESTTQEDSLNKLKLILRSRGIRGLIYLHKQFLLSCPDLHSIQKNVFTQILNIQHIKLSDKDNQAIFSLFPLDSTKEKMSFYNFIRAFKKELNDQRLSIIEKCFVSLENENKNRIPIDLLKLKYNTSQHPDCVLNKKSEDDVVMEFLDCIEQNYSLLGSDDDDNDGYMTFEMFANFYEYVSFLYDNDNEFIELIEKTWNL